MDKADLVQRPDVKRQKKREKTGPPRGQAKGPITKGPRTYEYCSTCSRIYGTKEAPLRIGVPHQLVRQHLEDHRMGRIRKQR